MLKKVHIIFISFLFFLKHLYSSRYVIGQLAKRDFKSRYLGSYMGLPWAFIQPLATILVMWFAFTYGLKINTIDGSTPFSLWLIVGIIAWFYASEIIISTSGCIKEYSYLIKNVNFKASIIPIIKIISSSVIHLFFIGFIFIVCLVYDKEPSLIWFQVIYYLFCILFLTTGIAWLTSSLYVFVKDISQVVNVIMQFFFWLTPIIWSVEIVPPYLLKYMKLNPFLYIVEGYRNTFIYEKWFFQDLNYLIYFWSLSILLFFIGAVTFHRLKPHFADVL